MKTFTVTWEIRIDAENPHAAALAALAIQLDPEYRGTAFTVTEHLGGPVIQEHHIDLLNASALEAASTQHHLPMGACHEH